MSTRANIIIKDSEDRLFFYRHSDGYPEGVMPTLNIFMSWLKSGKIRNNANQSAGWLIMLGAIEYNTIPHFAVDEDIWYKGTDMERIKHIPDLNTVVLKSDKKEYGMEWKVGAYEPTTSIHGDIEYLYIIDVEKKTLKCYDSWTEAGEGKHSVSLAKFKPKK